VVVGVVYTYAGACPLNDGYSSGNEVSVYFSHYNATEFIIIGGYAYQTFSVRFSDG
jgi:hypothetical protein